MEHPLEAVKDWSDRVFLDFSLSFQLEQPVDGLAPSGHLWTPVLPKGFLLHWSQTEARVADLT